MSRLKQICFFIFLISLSTLAAIAQNPSSKISVGDSAPNFTGVDQFGNEFELSEALKKGPVVLMFYRGYWCPYCNKQLSQLEDSLNFIKERGGIVVAVTPEKPESIKETISKTNASFIIIHDYNLKIMNQYGVTSKLDDELLRKYKSKGLFIEKNNGENGPNLPVPATYILGSDSKVLYSFYDPDYKKRATVGNILENI